MSAAAGLTRLREALGKAAPRPWEDGRAFLPGISTDDPLNPGRMRLMVGSDDDRALVCLLVNCADELVAVAEAAEALSNDEESQEGGWGPDVTMLIPLRSALAALREKAQA
ncbi:MAG: hypothetical protein NUW01_02845 [Gemmatimonadaceae bacterium]|nr:hypothetical protein [Gemmatimonadaceae bacterium]